MAHWRVQPATTPTTMSHPRSARPHGALLLLLAAARGGAVQARATPAPAGADIVPAADARLLVSRHAAPAFTALTPASAAFGLLGALGSAGGGKAFIKDNAIADPAPAIGRLLARALAERHGLAPAAEAGAETADDALDTLLAGRADSDYIVDVATRSWSSNYLPTHWSRYRINYRVHARLIDSKAGKVLAEGDCERAPDLARDSVAHELLTRQQGQFTKDVLASYAAGCARELARGMLGIASPALAELEARSLAVVAAQLAAGDGAPGAAGPGKVPYLPAKGQERFQAFLKRPLPRAFAISENGFSVSVSGTHPDDATLPSDPSARALALCKGYAQRECSLYMVDETLVYRR
ncbi:hypothetical protein [Janthinobacterium sp.]|uniref:hypothetical protein n=1 Tax=Janthinobacterium sp. TaxID=1871054 RepID=UPI00293D4018|nr:hypothetical protein [Janthinobacterium sp.]